MRFKFLSKNLASWIVLSLLVLFGCDSRHTILESFLPNGNETKLISFDNNVYLGQSVSIYGDVALVGARTAAYIYRRDGTGWKKEANLIIPDESPYWYDDYDAVGFSVALHGDIAVVGAPEIDYDPFSYISYGNSGSGAVYVYRYNGTNWKQQSKLTASVNPTANVFGYSVSFDGNTIAVGDPLSDFVYLYHYDGTNWIEQARLTPAEGAPDNKFGAAVSVKGDVLIVGAEESDLKAEDAGMACIYRFDGATWMEQSQLFASDAAKDDRFGTAVAASNDVVVIGAPGDDENTGSAYIFRYTGSSWIQETKLPFETRPYSWFGRSVAISENTVIIGVPFDEAGSAIVFRWNGTIWRQQEKLTPLENTFELQFGWSVALDGNLVIIGAPITGYQESYSYRYSTEGAAYVYTID